MTVAYKATGCTLDQALDFFHCPLESDGLIWTAPLSALDSLRMSGGAFVVCENSKRPELLRPHYKSAAAHARDTE